MTSEEFELELEKLHSLIDRKATMSRTIPFNALVVITMFWILAAGSFATLAIYSNYRYERDIASYWNLADKSSTISQKAEYMDKFVTALETSGLRGRYNALIMQTPDNSFDSNLVALKTLQSRLHQIQTMDLSSFEYQTAIQQITAQEQGEAGRMLDVFRGVWYQEHYFMLWDWVGGIQIGIMLVAMIIIVIIWIGDLI